MAAYITAETIKILRDERGLTQRALAEAIGVTDKAISKWESGRGLPDISLVEPLASALGVSVAELLTGDVRQNANRAGNPLRAKFYVLPHLRQRGLCPRRWRVFVLRRALAAP